MGTSNPIHATGAAAGLAAAGIVILSESLKTFAHIDMSPEFWAGVNAIATYGIGFYVHDQLTGGAAVEAPARSAAGSAAAGPIILPPTPPSTTVNTGAPPT